MDGDSMATKEIRQLIITMPWARFKYTLPRGDMDLIALVTDTALGYLYNEMDDGYRDEMPAETEFIEDIYYDIVNGEEMPLSLGGTEIMVSFGDDVRFMSADVIKSEIKDVWDNGRFMGAMQIEDSVIKC